MEGKYFQGQTAPLSPQEKQDILQTRLPWLSPHELTAQDPAQVLLSPGRFQGRT